MKIDSRRELFLDRRLIESLRQTRLTLHEPHPAGVALRFDLPWEGRYAGYPTIVQGSDGFQLYYRGEPEAGPDGNQGEVTCYAESSDGIHWKKPELDLFEVMGTRKNNVILAHHAPFSHNFAPFVDSRPGVGADERYKALAGVSESGLVAFASADGIHWRQWRPEAVFRDQGPVFDSQNNAFWSESEGCYVLYYRKFVDDIRTIARAESPDFEHWSPGKVIAFNGAAPSLAEQLYTNQMHPYFRAPHLYIATAARFMAQRPGLTEEDQRSLGLSPRDWHSLDCSDAVLMSSRGGNEIDWVFPQAFVRPGGDHRNWTSRNNYPARGIIQTGPAEMSVYIQRNSAWPTNYLQRMTLRLDGFASVNACHEEGQMLTRPLTFSGENLELNYATSAAGRLRVELQDEKGVPFKGFTLKDSPEIWGDEISRSIHWSGGGRLAELRGRSVRLRFVMREADLYSIRFV